MPLLTDNKTLVCGLVLAGVMLFCVSCGEQKKPGPVQAKPVSGTVTSVPVAAEPDTNAIVPEVMEDGGLGVKGLKLPLDHWPDGKVKTLFTATKARMLANGSIEADGVKVEMFDALGLLDSKVTAETCFYNKEKGLLVSDKDVCLDRRPGLQISGKGMEWNALEQTVTILSEAKITYTGPLKRRMTLNP